MDPLEQACRRLDTALMRLETAIEDKLARDAMAADDSAAEDRQRLIAALAAAEAERAGLLDANRTATERIDSTIARLRQFLDT